MDVPPELELDIPPAWSAAAETILARGRRRILVIGAADRGKSSFCRYLTRRLAAETGRVAFVDADIGQKDVGPPATISLAYLDDQTPLEAAGPTALYFVGDINPMRHFLPMVVGTRRLADAADTEHVVIDTTGLVHGSGRALKHAQIESLRPDVIVIIEKGRELEGLVREHRHLQLIRLRPSRWVRSKTGSARRAARQKAFRAYFENARLMERPVCSLLLQRTPLFSGRRVEDPRFRHAEKTPGGVLAVAYPGKAPEEKHLRLLGADFDHGLLCGVIDASGECCGLAVVDHIDFETMRITFRSPVAAAEITGLQFGDMRLEDIPASLSRSAGAADE